MSDEFRKIKSTGETRFVLEFSDAGSITSSGSIASIEKPLGELQRRAEPPKPRNFVAKNAKMGGAGQHKDKKKAAKQGDVKHKKPLAESYAEDLAKQVFDANPNINDENAVLDAAWPIVVQDLGKKTAMSMFNYDEDFPSDLVSVYDWLQKNQQGVAEGLGNFAKAIDNLHGWYQDDSSDPNIERYEFDDREGGYYAYGTIEHNLKTGEIAVDFEDKSGEYDGDIKATFNSIGDAMNALRRITTQHRYNTGKAQSFDRLGDRTLAGPDDVYKTDRAGKKGTLTKSRMDTMKMSSPYRKTGPKGVLPEQGVAEDFNGEYDDEAGMAHSNLLTSARAVQGLLDTIEDRDNLPEWAQEKIAKAEMMLVSVWDYLQSQKEQGIDPQQDMEEGRSYHDNRTGFSRGPRDDERHDLDVPKQDPREFRMYNLTVDGKPLNPQPIMGRSNLIKFGKQQAAAGVDLSNAVISLVDENVAEGIEDRSRFIRFNIWTVMDGDEEVMQHAVEGDPFFSAKKFMRDLDDEGYEFTHVVSPKGEVTYLPQFDPRNFPKDEVDEVAPKGWEGTVKAMKKHKEIDNPYALTNWMKNKGYQSHKKEDAYMESLAAKLANKLK